MIYVISFIVSIAFAFLLRYSVISIIEKSLYEVNNENATKSEYGLNNGIERAVIDTKQGKIIAHWCVSGKELASVFIVHGNGETVSDWVDTQLLLKSLGYNSFVFDYSGFGHSTGKTSTLNLFENTKTAWLYFCRLAPLNKPLIAIGHSLGSAFLLNTVNVLKPIPNKIITYGAFTSAREIALYLGKVPGPVVWLIPNLLNNVKAVKKLKKHKVCIVHSKADKKIPYAMSLKIAASNSYAEHLELESYHHNALYENSTEELWQLLLANQNEQ